MMENTYAVCGRGKGPFGVCFKYQKGGIEYDNIETRREARVICDVLNEGKGPAWDEIRDDVAARMRRQPKPKRKTR